MQLMMMPINKLNFKVRSDVHLARKIWHVTMVLIMAYIYYRVGRQMAISILAVAMLFFVGLDLIRLKFSGLNKVALTIFGRIMRRNEVDSPAGTTYLLSGVFIVVVLFSQEIVLLTLLFLAIADPAASYFGIRYGKDRIINNKSLQGTLAAFVCCTVIAFTYFSLHHFVDERPLLIALIAGVIGAASELLPIGKLDDNLTFPVVSSFLLWILFKVFL